MSEQKKAEQTKIESKPKKKLKRRNSSFNGLKALAIFSVIFYHLDVPWLQSGHLGVIIFLVLTGYFLTKSIHKDLRKGDSFNFSERFIKRIYRLFPSIAVLVIGTGILCMGFNHVLLTKMKPDILPGLTFTLNIADVVRNVSYFDNFGGTSPLLHLWYVGIDMQFCILWSFVLYMLLAERPNNLRRTRLVIFIMAAASAGWMSYLYTPGTDPSRVYYSLDTRAFSPLIGACVALYPQKSIKNFNEKLPWAGPLSLLALIVAMVAMPKSSELFYQGGMFLASILTGIVIASLATKNRFSLMLKNPVLAKIGAMSFSIYLWHFPIILLLDANTNTSGIGIKLLAILLSLAAGALNYRVVESSSTLSAESLMNGAKTSKRTLALLTAGSIAVWGASYTFPDASLIPDEAIQQANAGGEQVTQEAQELDEDKLKKAHETKMDLENLPSGDICLIEDKYLASKGVKSPVMIGDSVPTAIYNEFSHYFPDGLLDAKISRRPDVMQELLNSYLAQGIVGDIVILQAFNNTSVSTKMLEEMVEACGSREVYLVTIKVPESIESSINATLYACAEKHDNVHIIDWNGLVVSHMDEYLWGDKTHLKPNGADPYANLLANAISYQFAEKGGYVLGAEEAAQYQKTQEQIKDLQEKADNILTGTTKE